MFKLSCLIRSGLSEGLCPAVDKNYTGEAFLFRRRFNSSIDIPKTGLVGNFIGWPSSISSQTDVQRSLEPNRDGLNSSGLCFAQDWRTFGAFDENGIEDYAVRFQLLAFSGTSALASALRANENIQSTIRLTLLKSDREFFVAARPCPSVPLRGGDSAICSGQEVIWVDMHVSIASVINTFAG